MGALLGVLAGACGSSGTGWSGTYDAAYTGTGTVGGAGPVSYTDTGVINVTDQPDGQILMAWQVGGNAPSGTILFRVDGASAATAGSGVGTDGSCFSGTLANGNLQTTCCEVCSATLNGVTLTQAQQGRFNGTTPQGVAYSGTYSGTWTGKRR